MFCKFFLVWMIAHGLWNLWVAKFELKVGSRRTTKIENLVVLDIFLVALILIPYNMRFVLSSQNGICLLEKERVRIKTSKNVYGQLFSKKIQNISGSQEDNHISIFGCPHSIFGRRGHKDTEILLPWYIILPKYHIYLNMRCLYSIGMFGTNLGLLMGVLCKIWQTKLWGKIIPIVHSLAVREYLCAISFHVAYHHNFNVSCRLKLVSHQTISPPTKKSADFS